MKISRIDVIGQNGNDGAAYDHLCGECFIEGRPLDSNECEHLGYRSVARVQVPAADAGVLGGQGTVCAEADHG